MLVPRPKRAIVVALFFLATAVPSVAQLPPGLPFSPAGWAGELQQIYQNGQGIDPAKPTVAYCRIGERSSHTWFVLKYLLGIDDVRNYDGSWTEYGNLIGQPIER